MYDSKLEQKRREETSKMWAEGRLERAIQDAMSLLCAHGVTPKQYQKYYNRFTGVTK